MKIWKSVILTIFSLSCLPLMAETIYINYDNACVDQMEYMVIENGRARPYLVYRVRLGGDQFIYLDVGSETLSSFQRPNGFVSNCNNLTSWNRETVRQINNGTTNVFIVRRNVDGQNMVAASSAAYYSKNGAQMEYENADFDFTANLDYLNRGTPLSSSRSNSRISLETYALYDCSHLLTMRQTPNNTSVQTARFQFVPEFGIIEYQTGLFGDNQASNELKLSKINGSSFGDVMLTLCGGSTTTSVETARDATTSGGVFTGDGGVFTGDATTSAPQIPYNNECGVSVPAGYHVVNKGETLYAISRQYGVNLADLRNWNGLANNLIKPCALLKISATAGGSDMVSNTSTNTNTTTNTGNTTSNTYYPPTNTGANTTSVPADDFGVKHGLERTDMLWLNGQTYYIVKSGETVKQLAKRFGYTEERFRYINGLGEYERIYAGQRLRTTDCNCVETPASYNDYDTIDAQVVRDKGATSSVINKRVHVVREAETLYAIARKYNTTVDRIRDLNGLSSNEIIIPYQRLRID